MAEWLGNGLQNRVQQFDSAWYLKKALSDIPGGAFYYKKSNRFRLLCKFSVNFLIKF